MSSPVGLGAPRDPLVSMAGLFSLATAPGHNLNGDSLWRLFYLKAWLFLSIICGLFVSPTWLSPHYPSRAKRSPVICQRAEAGKKLR